MVLVAVFGFGGGIGWFPLGFGEPFFPVRLPVTSSLNESMIGIRLSAQKRLQHEHSQRQFRERAQRECRNGDKSQYLHEWQAVNRGATRLTPGLSGARNVTNSVGIKPDAAAARSARGKHQIACSHAAARFRTAGIARTARRKAHPSRMYARS